MTQAWWEITGAAAFGQVALAWRLRELGPFELLHLTREPGLALLVQALVLWLAGTSPGGVALSCVAGFAVMLLASRFRSRRHRDEDENPYRKDS